MSNTSTVIRAVAMFLKDVADHGGGETTRAIALQRYVALLDVFPSTLAEMERPDKLPAQLLPRDDEHEQ